MRDVIKSYIETVLKDTNLDLYIGKNIVKGFELNRWSIVLSDELLNRALLVVDNGVMFLTTCVSEIGHPYLNEQRLKAVCDGFNKVQADE